MPFSDQEVCRDWSKFLTARFNRHSLGGGGGGGGEGEGLRDEPKNTRTSSSPVCGKLLNFRILGGCFDCIFFCLFDLWS